jgi:ribulose-phosphate 3-epimerase
MIEIIPAILPKSLEDLTAHVERVHTVAPWIQIDVVDGTFAHNKTWPYSDPASFERIISGEEGLPFWDTCDFEFDLMVEHPEHEATKFVSVGAMRLVVHASSAGALTALQELQSYRMADLPIEVGVALRTHASAEDLKNFEGLFDYVQVMGIDKVGFQGEAFDDQALSLVAAVHAMHPSLPVQVDGGVKLENIEAIVRAGATRLVAGSAIFDAEDPGSAIAALKTHARS